MPPELPTKMWTHIFSQYLSSPHDLRALSSTNKSFRKSLLVLLFQRVEFTGFLPVFDLQYHFDEESQDDYLVSLLDLYTRTCKRVTSLRRRPYLLNHIKIIHIRGWSHLSLLLEEDPDIWHSPTYAAAADAWTRAYHALGTLVSAAPGLTALAISSSPITKKMQVSFYCRPALVSLLLSACDVQVRRSKVLRRKITSCVKELVYEPSPYARGLDTNIRQIISGSLPALISLKIRMDCVADMIALLASTSLPTLRHLSISECPFGPIGCDEGSSEEDVYSLLRALPQLKTLKIFGWIKDGLPELGAHAPPDLDYVSGTSSVVQSLIPGRPIHSMHIQYCPLDPVTTATFLLSSPSTVPVKKVYIECGTTFSARIFEALGSAFRNLQHLTIRFVRGYNTNSDRTTTIHELWHPILVTLPSLLVYHATDACHPGRTDIDRTSTAANAECPVARRSEVENRGHPTLRELRILSRFTWIWLEGEGWECREFEDT